MQYALQSCFVSSLGTDLFQPGATLPSCAYAPAWIAGDPHAHGAHGDQFDFKGAHNGVYVLLSSPRLSLAVQFVHEHFFTPYSKMLVRGSWIRHAFWVVRTRIGDRVRIGFHASDPKTFLVYRGSDDTGVTFGEGQPFTLHDVRITLARKTLVVETSTWTTRATVNTGRPHPGKKRMDVRIQPLAVEAAFPHGLLGQTYDGDQIPLNGKRDNYEILDDGSRTRARTSVGGVITTRAKGEGGIEGDAEDYRIQTPFETAFKFSRFGNMDAVPPRIMAHGRASPIKDTPPPWTSNPEATDILDRLVHRVGG